VVGFYYSKISQQLQGVAEKFLAKLPQGPANVSICRAITNETQKSLALQR